MKYDCQNLIDRMNQGEELSFVFFWGHTEKLGRVTKACLSQ